MKEHFSCSITGLSIIFISCLLFLGGNLGNIPQLCLASWVLVGLGFIMILIGSYEDD